MTQDRHLQLNFLRSMFISSIASALAIACSAPDAYEDPETYLDSQERDAELSQSLLEREGSDLEEEGSESLGSLQQELRAPNNRFTTNCTGDKLTLVTQVFNTMQARIWTEPGVSEFRQCLKDAIFSSSYAYPEMLLNALRENIATVIECGPSDSGNADPEKIIVGQFAFDAAQANLDNHGISKVRTLGELMFHELAHTKGRLLLPNGTGHPGPEEVVNGTGDCVQGCIERQMAITTLVSSCLFDSTPMDWVTAQAPNFIPSRSLMASQSGEAVLSPVGTALDMNNPAENFCVTNEVGVGLSGRFGALVDAAGMVCRLGTNESSNAPTGGNGGVAFDTRCPANEKMVGIKGRAGAKIDAIGAVCALSTSIANGGSASNVNLPLFGGAGGTSFERRCPARHIVKGMRVRQDGAVQRLDVVCQVHDSLRNIATTTGPRLGGTLGTQLHDEHCPSRSAMDKLWGVGNDAGNALSRLGAGCATISNASAGAEIIEWGGANMVNHMLPFHGFPQTEGNGKGDTASCGADSLLVGLTTYSLNNSVRAVRGICATDAGDWSTGASTATVLTAEVGSASVGAISATHVCPSRSFLTGWRIAEDPTIAPAAVATSGPFSITPRCRRF